MDLQFHQKWKQECNVSNHIQIYVLLFYTQFKHYKKT